MASTSGRSRGGRHTPVESSRVAARFAPESVVLVSFGPRSVTRAARRRLNTVLGPNTVVTEVFRPLSSHEEGLPASAGLIRVMEGCPPGPVLFVHDDVSIGAASIERLMRAHLEGAGVAVPETNDRDGEQFHGQLPPAAAAGPALAELEATTEFLRRPTASVRPTCLVADRDTLVDLARRRVHDPLTVLNDRGAGFEIVEGAFAAHDASCARRLPHRPLGGSPPLMVAAMIVRDEEAMLAACLTSLEGVVDRVEILDTGSTDATVDIALSHGAVVTTSEWRDDFAWARNRCLENCRDADFVLWIDADERVRCPNPELLRRSLAAFPGDLEALEVSMANIRDTRTGEVSSRFTSMRLVRADLLGFRGSIHEMPVRRDDPSVPLEATPTSLLTIDHLGYQDEVIDVRDKRTRNLELARAQYEATGSAKAALDYARSLMLAGESPDEAVDLLRSSVSAARGTRVDWTAYLEGSLAHLLMERDELEEAYELARSAFTAVPRDDLAAAVLARTAVDLNRTAEFTELALNSTQPGPDPVFTSEENREVFRRLLLEALIAEGRSDRAWELVTDWWGEVSPPPDETWPAISAAAIGARGSEAGTEALVDLGARCADAGGLVSALAALVPPSLTAIAAASLLSLGVTAPDAATTGLIAATVAGEWALYDVLSSHADELDPVVRTRLSVRLDQAGQHERAASLRGGQAAGGLLGLAGLAGPAGRGD